MSTTPTKPRIVAFSGSTRRPSKSRTLAQAIGASVQARLDADVAYYDIVDGGPGLGAAYLRSALPPEALGIVEAIEQADAIIAVSPTYKGSYTGLFKHLIDFVDPKALAQKPVVVGATGAGYRHALVTEHQLRPLFGFFSAIVMAGIYAADQEFTEGQISDADLRARVDVAGVQLALALSRR